jgi:hypothetical protein
MCSPPCRPSQNLVYEHMFYSTTDLPHVKPTILARAKVRAHNLFELSVAFLTLDDGTECQWMIPDEGWDLISSPSAGDRQCPDHPHRRRLTYRARDRRAGTVADPVHHCISPIAQASARVGRTSRQRQHSSAVR